VEDEDVNNTQGQQPDELEGGVPMNVGLSLGQPALYQICVQGYLGDCWAGLFEGMTLISNATQGTTVLIGVVPDQAALHGILARIRDLGLPLFSLTYITDERVSEGGEAE
jgi:hypothetical protein